MRGGGTPGDGAARGATGATTGGGVAVGTGVAVGAGRRVGVADGLGMLVGVSDGSSVAVALGVGISVAVCVGGTGVGEAVSVGVAVRDGLGDGVAVRLGRGVALGLGEGVAVRLGRGVLVGLGVNVAVGSGVGVGVLFTIVTVTVAGSLSASPSLAVYVNVSSPRKKVLCVYATSPSGFNTTLPRSGWVRFVTVSDCISTSKSFARTGITSRVRGGPEAASSLATGGSLTELTSMSTVATPLSAS